MLGGEFELDDGRCQDRVCLDVFACASLLMCGIGEPVRRGLCSEIGIGAIEASIGDDVTVSDRAMLPREEAYIFSAGVSSHVEAGVISTNVSCAKAGVSSSGISRRVGTSSRRDKCRRTGID